MRAHLSVTLVAMTDNHSPKNSTDSTNATNTDKGVLKPEGRSLLGVERKWTVFRTYNRTKSNQDTISASFFAGYCIMQIPQGIFSQKFGGKIPLMVALLTNSIISIIMPWTPLIGGWWAVCGFRFLQGLTQSALYPSTHTILGHWAPLCERGRLSSYAYTGIQMGTTLAFITAGWISGNPKLGWPFMFWLSGCLGFIAFWCFYFLGSATPSEHPTISESEKLFIMDGVSEEKYTAKRVTPWKSILTCVPFWAGVFAQVGSAFAFVICLLEIPVYISSVLGVGIKKNGLLSSLPYVSMYIFNMLFGLLSDFIVNRKYMKLINVRRLGNTLGLPVCGLFILGFAYAKTVPVAIALLVLAFGAHSGVHVGFLISNIDLAPNFAGTLMSIGNFIGSSMGVVAPAVVAYIVEDASNQSQWQKVFISTLIAMFLTNLVYVIFIKTDVQSWNNIDNDSNNGESDYVKLNTVVFASKEN